MGRILPKRGYFENFQSSISPLRLMIELRSSLLTYRNSYIAYPKNLFSMTLNFYIKVKWHMCLALVYFRQKGQHNCLRIPPKLLRRILFSSKHYSFFRFLKFLLIFATMGSNFSKVS